MEDIMFLINKKGGSDYKDSEVIKKVIKVYNSCKTLEQLVLADRYAELAIKRLSLSLSKNAVDLCVIDFRRMHMSRYTANLPIR